MQEGLGNGERSKDAVKREGKDCSARGFSLATWHHSTVLTPRLPVAWEMQTIPNAKMDESLTGASRDSSYFDDARREIGYRLSHAIRRSQSKSASDQREEG